MVDAVRRRRGPDDQFPTSVSGVRYKGKHTGLPKKLALTSDIPDGPPARCWTPRSLLRSRTEPNR